MPKRRRGGGEWGPPPSPGEGCDRVETVGTGEVGQVVVRASLSNPQYFAIAGAVASVPYRILHGAERAARSERGILPSQPREARLAYGPEGVGRPAINPLGGFPPHLFRFLAFLACASAPRTGPCAQMDTQPAG